MHPLKVGIIGTGQIAQHHMRVWTEFDDFEIAVICDVDQEALERSAKKFGVSETTTDFREVINRDDIIAVDVCLHNNLHAPIAIAAMEAGKHVYCEKPIAGSYVDGVAMIEAAERTGRMLHIQLNTLFKDFVHASKQLIDNGALGEIYHARVTAHRRRGRPYIDGYGTNRFVQKAQAGGGALYDIGIYNIAQMLYLIGNPEVERICGRTFQKMAMDPGREATANYDVEELGMGFINFKNGIAMDLIISWAIHMNPFEGSYLVGDKGGIRLEPFSFHNLTCDLEMDSTVNLRAMESRRHMMDEHASAYDCSQKHWAAVLQDKVPLIPTAKLALNTMLIQEGVYLSEELKREVTAAEVIERSASTAVKL